MATDKQRKWANSSFLNGNYRLKKYGLSSLDYHNLFIQQEGKCKICGKHPDNKRLCVDHCHLTGKVRGLLCHSCNLALGHAFDDSSILRKMAEYIDKSK